LGGWPSHGWLSCVLSWLAPIDSKRVAKVRGLEGWRGLMADTPKTNKQTSQMLHYILVVVAPAPGFQTGVGAGAQVGIVIAIAIAAVAKLVAHVGY